MRSNTELLPASLGILLNQLLDVTVRNGEWVVSASRSEPATSRPEERPELDDEIFAILAGAAGGLTTTQIIERLRTPAELSAVRGILFSADEVAIAAGGGWVYSAKETSQPALDPDALVPAPAEPVMEDQSAVRRLSRFAVREEASRILQEADCPLGTDMLVARMGAVDSRMVKETLSVDQRFVRSDIDAWALTAWGMRPYTTVKELVGEELDKAGGVIEASRLVGILTREFSIKESTIRQAMSSAPFCVKAGVVRRLADVSTASGLPEQLVIEDKSTAGLSAEELMRMLGL
ncbi:hypothetical protein F7Q99_21395 [Streptomyces kaniharaensis]|uniref:Uncharacterized protein n=1 Tax=Streptomyces kaniharaensis TaxID=212423 RepID=A0A6N7KWQ1_9ACTN|nr:hypothetical protein [Streptomyces kaniharaensis]MQS14747.1 hypothetical protein [Streptomyces kaniharaensis]